MTDWSASIGLLQRLRHRLQLRLWLERGLLLLAAVSVAGCVLLIAAHVWPAASLALALTGLAATLALLAALVRTHQPIALQHAAWLADRRLLLPEQAVSALEVSDSPFAPALRQQTAALLADTSPAELIPLRFGARTAGALAAAGCFALLILLLGLPDPDPQATADRKTLDQTAAGLRKTARSLNDLGQAPLSRRLDKLAGKLKQAATRKQGRLVGATALSKMQAEQQRAQGADRALDRLSRQPALSRAVKAARRGDARQLARQVSQLRAKANSDGAGLSRRTAASLQRAARVVRDPALARRLREIAELTGRGTLPEGALRKLLTDLAQQAARKHPLSLAITRLQGAIRQLGGTPASPNARGADAAGDANTGELDGKPKAAPPIDNGPLPPLVAENPTNLEQLFSQSRWPPEDDSLVRGYFREVRHAKR